MISLSALAVLPDRFVSAQNVFPELMVQQGAGDVRSLVFAPNGRFLVSGGNGVKIWDISSGRLLRSFPIDRPVASLALSADGRQLAVGVEWAEGHNNIELWDVSSGRRTAALGTDHDVTWAVQFDEAGVLIAATGERIVAWDVATATATPLLALDQRTLQKGPDLWTPGFTAIAVVPGGRFVAAANNIGEIHLIDRPSTKVARVIAAHKGAVMQLAVSPDGATLASGGKYGMRLGNVTSGSLDNDVALWDLATGNRLATFRSEKRPLPAFGNADGDVVLLAFSNDGQRLIIGGQNHAIKVWNVPERTVEHVWENVPARAAAANADWSLFATNRVSGITLLESAGTRIHTVGAVEHSERAQAGGGDAGGTTIAFGGLLVSADTFEPISVGRRPLASQAARVLFVDNARARGTAVGGHWPLASITRTESGEEICPAASDWPLLSVSGNGRTAALLGTELGSIVLCDLTTGTLGSPFKGGGNDVIQSVAFSADGNRIVSGGWNGVVRMWSSSGQLLQELRGHTAQLNDVTFSPDGTLVVSAASGREVPGTGLRIRIGADGQNVIEYPETTIRFWDADTGALLRTLEGHAGGTYSVAISDDGKVLASTGRDRAIKLWDVEKGVLLRTLQGVADDFALLFHPEGWLIVPRANGSITLVDPETGAVALSMAYAGTEWLTIDPNGRFDGSPGGWKRVLWRMSDDLFDVHPVEVGFRQFFTPGLARDVVSRTALSPLTRSIAETDLRRPSVAIVASSDSADRPVSTRTITVRVVVTDGGTGARDVRLFRNGSLVKLWRQDLAFASGPVSLEAQVPVGAGDNVFTAYAFSRDDVKADDATLTVTGAPELKRPGRLFVLAVGVNTYADSRFNLKYARADAEAIGAAIKAQNRLSPFTAVEIVPLVDADATRQNILAAVSRIAGVPWPASSAIPTQIERLQTLEPEDVAVIYYAGHGAAAGKRFHLLPHDFSLSGDDAAGLSDSPGANTVSDLDLENVLMQGSATGRIVLILDACNSGQVLTADDPRRGPMNSRGLGQLAYERGMYVLAASQAFQAALETPRRGHGNLTFALLEGLNGAVRRKGTWPVEEVIPALTLLDYAARRVPELQREDTEAVRSALLAAKPTRDVVQRPRLFSRDEVEQGDPLIIGLAQK